MVQRRRPSRSGAKWTSSESPEQTRHLRPKANIHEDGSAFSEAQPYHQTLLYAEPRPSHDQAHGQYRGPLQASPAAFRAHQGQALGGPQSPDSAVSTGSLANSSLGQSSYDSSSIAQLERGRNLSPHQHTPTRSIASLDGSINQDRYVAFVNLPGRPDRANDFYAGGVFPSDTSEPLAGINTIYGADGEWHCTQQRESAASSTMLPSALQHLHDLEEPWSAFGAQPEEQSQSAYSNTLGGIQSARNEEITLSSHFSSHLNIKPGRRSGPLSNESRLNANDVRKERSCLRCFVMKETCDTSKETCHNCQRKQARTWKLGCVRPRLMFRTMYLLPEILASRLERRYVDSFIQHKGWACTDRPRFAISLDIGLKAPLVLPVREFLPVGDLDRPAYLTVDTEDGPVAKPITMYDLPVIISCEDEALAARHIRTGLRKWLDHAIQCTRENEWAWHWFHEGTDAFGGDIMEEICDYFDPTLQVPQHELLRDALGLSFFNYLFISSFDVPKPYHANLVSRMENPPPGNVEYVSPSTINLYIKMLMLPPLRDVVKRTLKGLEALLLEQQNTSIWRRDLIFCVSFIVLAYLGKTQVSVLQFAHQPIRENGKILTQEEAETQVWDMEENLADLIISYHRQFLAPSPRRRQQNAIMTKEEQTCEMHAKSYGLSDKIQNIRRKHAAKKPATFNLDCSDIGNFVANNTNRICWKFVEAVLPPSQSRPQAQAQEQALHRQQYVHHTGDIDTEMCME